MAAVCVKFYGNIPCDRREILRYAGVRSSLPQMEELLDECLKETCGVFSAKTCYGEFPVKISGRTVDFGFAAANSADLALRLNDCRSAVIFAATAGAGIDRLIMKYSVTSPAKAVIMQAIGTEKIESLCDTFCDDLKNDLLVSGKTVTSRYSAGYGDLSLEFQRDIFAALDCPRKIGVMLGENLIMSPSKSVTAIVGIKNALHSEEHGASCESCGKKDCEYRS